MKISKSGLTAGAALFAFASSAQASLHGEGSGGDWFLLILYLAAPWLLLFAVAVALLVLLIKRLGRSPTTRARAIDRKPD